MKNAVAVALAALTIATSVAPAFAQSLEIILPTLTWPDDQVTISTQGEGASQK